MTCTTLPSPSTSNDLDGEPRRYDTPPSAIPCTGCGAPPSCLCARRFYCPERVRAAMALDVELAVDLLPSGLRVCEAVVAHRAYGKRAPERCGERVPWFSPSCPHCATPTMVTMPEWARRTVVEALARTLVGPTGTPLAGWVLHHLREWGFAAVGLYLHHALTASNLVARVHLARLRLPREAGEVCDVLAHVVRQVLDERRRAPRPRPATLAPIAVHHTAPDDDPGSPLTPHGDGSSSAAREAIFHDVG